MDNIKNIVNGVIDIILKHQPKDDNKLDRVWQNVIEKSEIKHTKLLGLKEGILFINVDSPTWLFYMKNQKNKLLKRLQEEIEEVKDLRFKIGKCND